MIDKGKRLVQQLEDLEEQRAQELAKVNAKFKKRIDRVMAKLLRMGQEMTSNLDGVPPEKWPKGVAPAEGSLKNDSF